ncbi:MAG: hypothetical protein ABUL72_06385 [Armatimonadota bacterium]
MRNFARSTLYIFVVLALSMMSGCIGGGGGGGDTGGGAGVSGLYHCGYTRGSGTIYLFFSSPNQVDISLSDTDYGFFHGTGTLSNGIANVPISANGKNINVKVEITQDHQLNYIIFVSVTGDFAATGFATFDGANVATVFAGDYSGGNSGGTTGPFQMHVNANGSVTMTTQLDGQTYIETGTLGNSAFTEIKWFLNPAAPNPNTGIYDCWFSILPSGKKRVSGSYALSNVDGQGRNLIGNFQGDTP